MSLHVDLEAQVNFGGRQAAAHAPVFRAHLDQRDLDVERGNVALAWLPSIARKTS
jgi:hypothetical protein